MIWRDSEYWSTGPAPAEPAILVAIVGCTNTALYIVHVIHDNNYYV